MPLHGLNHVAIAGTICKMFESASAHACADPLFLNGHERVGRWAFGFILRHDCDQDDDEWKMTVPAIKHEIRQVENHMMSDANYNYVVYVQVEVNESEAPVIYPDGELNGAIFLVIFRSEGNHPANQPV